MKELLIVKLVEEADGEINVEISADVPSAKELDLLIQSLGKVRGQTKPPVPAELPKHLSQLEIAPAPGWFVGEAFPQGQMLGLRHPSYGWIGFQLTPEVKAGLLQALAEAPQVAQDHSPKH